MNSGIGIGKKQPEQYDISQGDHHNDDFQNDPSNYTIDIEL